MLAFNIGQTLLRLWNDSGVNAFFVGDGWKSLVMIAIACVFLYLGIVKKFEPLLLVGIAFGCLLSNLPMGGMYHQELWTAFMDKNSEFYHSYGHVLANGGLLDFFYIGVKTSLYPCLIFLGVGAMTDFGPLLSNPKSMLMGASAQMGVFVAFFLAIVFGFTGPEAASIGTIGGADGPTAIFLTSKLAPWLLGPIAIAAYSYMALIPLIQPPFMKLLTTKKERQVVMKQTREVSKTEKIIFPIVVTIFVAVLLPSTAPLIGCLMLGNLFRECGVTARLSDTVQNALMNIVTIMLSTAVGATMVASSFLSVDTLKIIALGVFAFILSTVGGLLMGKILYVVTKGKVNPLIGSAGVSAVPMAARVSPGCGPEIQPQQLPADARYGSQCGRRHWLRHCGRLPAVCVRRLRQSAENGPVARRVASTTPPGNQVRL